MDNKGKIKDWLAFFVSSTVMLLVLTGVLFWMLLSGRGADKTFTDVDLDVRQMSQVAMGENDIYTPTPDPLVDQLYLPAIKERVVWKTRVPLTTNTSGMRFPTDLKKKREDVFRVVILGDSMIAAHAAPYEDGVVPQLEGILNRALTAANKPYKRVEVYPVAVAGWNIFSELAYLTHNLHRIQPDVVIHGLINNDFDSGFGFINGNYRTQAYDTQGLFGISHMSTASPSIALRVSTPVRSVLGSNLIPESKQRYQRAYVMMKRLKMLLKEYYGAEYFLYLRGNRIAYGVMENFGGLVKKENIVIGPAGVEKHNLLPLDGHPNRLGHLYSALALAHFLSDMGILKLDKNIMAKEGDYVPYRKMIDSMSSIASARKVYDVDKIPASISIEKDKLKNDDSIRTVVGGLYYGGVLSPRTILVLRKQNGENVLSLKLEFPPVPALNGQTMMILVNGVEKRTIEMAGIQSIDIMLDEKENHNDLVEVVLESDAYFTEPYMHIVDGIYGGTPRTGKLIMASLSRRH
jgi:hypothetical protein